MDLKLNLHEGLLRFKVLPNNNSYFLYRLMINK